MKKAETELRMAKTSEEILDASRKVAAANELVNENQTVVNDPVKKEEYYY